MKLTCEDCYWCGPVLDSDSKKRCCNQSSANCDRVFSLEEAKIMECDDAETERAVDYRNMTAWQFASKYYI